MEVSQTNNKNAFTQLVYFCRKYQHFRAFSTSSPTFKERKSKQLKSRASDIKICPSTTPHSTGVAVTRSINLFHLDSALTSVIQHHQIKHRPVSSVVKHVAIGTRGLGFDSRTGQFEHRVTDGSPPLRRFFGTVLPRRSAAEMGTQLVTRFCV